MEVCYDGTYETVCDDFWDELEATVVCNQLNFTSPDTSEKSISFVDKAVLDVIHITQDQ